MARQTFELRRTYTYDYSILSPDDQVENSISFCKDIGSASKEAKDVRDGFTPMKRMIPMSH